MWFEVFKRRLLGQEVEIFECPICAYTGLFRSVSPPTGVRKHAMCSRCGSLERHRAQWLTMQIVSKERDFSRMRALHIAPEDFFRTRFKSMFREYKTADLDPKGVDYAVDLTKPLPFPPGSVDLVYASHVLEHIHDDAAALENIRRILSPNGIAILPVPILAEYTVEYPEPNPAESFHVRAPGWDYYDRYRKHFSDVRLFSSNDFDAKFQTFVYEDRSCRHESMPLRPVVAGSKFPDTVPVCSVG